MEFKHSMSILFSNLRLTFKLMLYVLIAFVIVGCLLAATILPVVNSISAEASMGALIQQTFDHIELFLREGGLKIFYQNMGIDFTAMWQTFTSDIGVVVGIAFALFLLYCVYELLITLSEIPTAFIIDSSMSSNMEYKFLPAFTITFKKSVRYTLAKVLVYLPIDALILAICGGLAYGLWLGIKLFALPVVFVLLLVLFSLKFTLFAGWVPRMLYHPEETAFVALKNSFKEMKDFKYSLFVGNIVILFLAYTMTVLFALPTFGIMFFVTVPLGLIAIRVMELVSYFKSHSMKFYVDANTIIDTVDYGLRAENQEKEM